MLTLKIIHWYSLNKTHHTACWSHNKSNYTHTTDKTSGLDRLSACIYLRPGLFKQMRLLINMQIWILTAIYKPQIQFSLLMQTITVLSCFTSLPYHFIYGASPLLPFISSPCHLHFLGTFLTSSSLLFYLLR